MTVASIVSTVVVAIALLALLALDVHGRRHPDQPGEPAEHVGATEAYADDIHAMPHTPGVVTQLDVELDEMLTLHAALNAVEADLHTDLNTLFRWTLGALGLDPDGGDLELAEIRGELVPA